MYNIDVLKVALFFCISVFSSSNCFEFQEYRNSYPSKVITIWGQNYASKKIGAKEPDLETLCLNSPYDVIIIGYVTRFFDTINSQSQYPGMDFSVHCDTSNKVDGVQCPFIQNAIKICHQHRKKVLLAIGGPNAVEEFTRFENEEQAEQLATNLWNLFLGGTQESLVRPFGSETLDGINIELRHGESQFMNVFIERLHEFRKSRPEVQDILITFSSTCDYPDLYLGPDYGKPLEDEVAMELIDQIYVFFTKESCCVFGSDGFQTSIQLWDAYSTKTKTDLAIGVAPSKYAVENPICFNSPERVAEALKPWKEKNPYLTSVMIIDNSFDIDGKRRFVFTSQIKYNRDKHLLPNDAQLQHQDLLLPTTTPITTPITIGMEELELPQTTLLPTTINELETTLPPLVNEADNLVINSTTEGQIGHEEELETQEIDHEEEEHEQIENDHQRIEEEHREKEKEHLLQNHNQEVLEPVMAEDEEQYVFTTTLPPATRAAPLIPNVAMGRIPPNPYPQWDFAQVSEIQRKRANCTNVLGNHYKWQVRCAQPPGQLRKPNKSKGLKIKFKSPFKPNYIPNTKSKKKQAKVSKQIKHEKRTRRKNNKKVSRKIKFKSPFKPSYIPNTMRKNKKKGMKERHNKKHSRKHKKGHKHRNNRVKET